MTIEQQSQIRQLRKEGAGYKRIAAVMNLSVNTVKSFCHREEKDEKRINLVERQCRNCGKTIWILAGKKARIFCSDVCRIAYWRTQAVPEQQRACLGCGTKLMGRAATRKYCCHACYISHRFGGKENAG